jgi:hypothetical protein
MMIGVRSFARAQAPADRQTVFAREHQIEDDQVHGLACQHAIERLRVLGQEHLESLLRQVAAQQVPDAGIIVDDGDAIGAGVGGSAHGGFPICNNADFAQVCCGFSGALTTCYKICAHV